MSLPPGWKLVGPLIESGQAHVYCVSHPEFELPCALKRLKNPRRAERFAREVRVMTGLAQAGAAVPAVVASDLDARKPWYAMRWFDDGSMEAWLSGGASGAGLRDDIRRVTTLARAVADVHRHGVAHRDLKPANVLVDGDQLLLTDFGLCLEVEDEDRVTDTLEAVGSRLYIAPENESGIHEELDQRPADFYAFGKICWSVVLHRQPLARELASEPENSLVRLLGDARVAPLDALVRDLLARDPRARLRDWDVVLRELASVNSVLSGTESSHVRTTRRTVVDAARRMRDLTVVTRAGERQKERDRADTWKVSLLREMAAAARPLEAAMSDLHEALDGILTITPTTGGASDADTLQHVHRELPPVTPLESVTSQAAVVLLLHSQTGIDAFPTIVVRICAYVDDAGDLYFASVPHLARHGAREEVAEGLLPWLARLDGPHPRLRQATIDVARRFVTELTETFVAAVEHYIVVLSAGGDPADPQAWQHLELDAESTAPRAVEAGDVTPPDLRSFELIPDEVQLGASGATITCRVRLVDDGAGVAGTGYRSSPSQARLVSPGGQLLDAVFTDRSLVSGDSNDGIYEDHFAFAPAAERGRWVIAAMMTVDAVGNTRRYSTPELRELGFTTVIHVK